MKPLRHVREPIRPPSFSDLPGALKADLVEMSQSRGCLVQLAPEEVAKAPDECFRTLRHELSAHYLALRNLGPPAARSRIEFRVLTTFEADPQGLSTASPSEFRNRLASLNHAVTGGQGGWRTAFVKLSDDKAGNQIYFPPAAAVPGQLERLRLLLAYVGDAPPLFTAAVAHLLLLNCHPFTDGNGRTSRLLFNYLLRRGGMQSGVYFPLYEIARRSHGGYEIALRTAELHGDWAPFLQWLLEAIRCYRAIAG